MKWKGTVSHAFHTSIAPRFATAKMPHAISSLLGLGKPIPRMPDRLDWCVGPELLPQPADADLDDVRARVEVVAPDLGEQPLAAHDLARMAREMVQQAELPVG